MRLISLKLKNFRQFYGPVPTITFAHGDKNVTVIHGCNGAGKTALLNSFTWCLYDSLSRGFQLQDQIVNKRALREAKVGETVEAWVEIVFEHHGNKHEIKKVTKIRKISTDDQWESANEDCRTLLWCGPDGKCEKEKEERIPHVIGRILPLDLHTYFFFDGERIERIVEATKEENENIANATKKFLGIEVFERAERHLKAAKKDLEKELEKIGDPETTRFLEEKRSLEEELDQIIERQNELEKNIKGHESQERELNQRLKALEGAKDVQIRRETLSNDLKGRKDSLSQNQRNLAKIISSKGYFVFLDKAIEYFHCKIEELRKLGELPSGIKKQFVSDLLIKNECICGTLLGIGEPARLQVENWMRRAGISEVEETILRMGGEINQIDQSIPEFWERIDQIKQKIELDQREISRIEQELEDINEQLRNSPKEDISGIERRLDETKEANRSDLREQGANKAKQKDISDKVEKIDSRILTHQSNEERQKLAQRRISGTNEAIKRIVETRNLFEGNARQKLNKRINKIFNEITYTPYVPNLTENYSLELLESSGGSPLPVAASQGESQILSLAFIGSIIEIHRENEAQKLGIPLPDSSHYPVIMDSPFGSLDPIYRHQIAEHLPRFSDQIVVLASLTQWRNEVERSLDKKIGRSYILTYFSPRKDLPNEIMSFKGETYELIKQSPNEFEYTEIREITND